MPLLKRGELAKMVQPIQKKIDELDGKVEGCWEAGDAKFGSRMTTAC